MKRIDETMMRYLSEMTSDAREVDEYIEQHIYDLDDDFELLKMGFKRQHSSWSNSRIEKAFDEVIREKY